MIDLFWTKNQDRGLLVKYLLVFLSILGISLEKNRIYVIKIVIILKKEDSNTGDKLLEIE